MDLLRDGLRDAQGEAVTSFWIIAVIEDTRLWCHAAVCQKILPRRQPYARLLTDIHQRT